MTIQELRDRLDKLFDQDLVQSHYDGEDLLLKFINDKEVSDTWEQLSLEWWYA